MNSDRLAELHAIAAVKGGACLSTHYQGLKAVHRFRCAQGHEWEARAGNILYDNRWCRLCGHKRQAATLKGRSNPARQTPERLAELHAMATGKGGACLSDTYRGVHAKYRFRCTHGHEWEADGASVLHSGHWCLHCGRARSAAARRQRMLEWHQVVEPLRLQELQAAATARGGECMATEYRGQDARYLFRCRDGHEWEARAAHIREGRWCSRCQRDPMQRKLTARKGRPNPARLRPERLMDLQAFATARGGMCLSQEYRGMKARYRFRCSQGHEWDAKGYNLLTNGTWCRPCQNESQRHGIEAMHVLAESRGGRCLSEEYANGVNHLRWQCHRGHVWSTAPRHVLRGHWCPACKVLDQTKNPFRRKRYEAVP